jgi:hypothetical protein
MGQSLLALHSDKIYAINKNCIVKKDGLLQPVLMWRPTE